MHETLDRGQPIDSRLFTLKCEKRFYKFLTIWRTSRSMQVRFFRRTVNYHYICTSNVNCAKHANIYGVALKETFFQSPTPLRSFLACRYSFVPFLSSGANLNLNFLPNQPLPVIVPLPGVEVSSSGKPCRYLFPSHSFFTNIFIQL